MTDTTIFRTLDGVSLSRAEWNAVMDAGHDAFDRALGDDYGNLMEARLVAMEMGDMDAVAAYDARANAARAAESAAHSAMLAAIDAADKADAAAGKPV